MNTFHAAVVGTGFMGWVHIEALRRAGVIVLGVLGSSPAKSRSMAEQYGIPKAYQNFEELLADTTIDSVHLGVPNKLHFDLASRAILAGKHVMCEKPLAMNASESAELVKLAAANPNVACGVNYNIRYYPLCIETMDRIQRGRIGKVFHITGSYVQDWLLKPNDYNWRVLTSEGGELRAVSDIGTHWLDLIQAITGLEIEAVCADLATVHPIRHRPKGEVQTFKSKEETVAETEPINITTDDYGAILLRFTGGTRGVMHVSQVSSGRKNCLRFEIAGSEASFAWNSEAPNELWIGQRDTANQLLIRDPALLSAAARNFADYPGGHNEGYDDSFKMCFRAFYQSIDRGDFTTNPSFPTFKDGHREILLCDAILQSHREQRWITIGATS
jgi:predicted dehydrogenase